MQAFKFGLYPLGHTQLSLNLGFKDTFKSALRSESDMAFEKTHMQYKIKQEECHNKKNQNCLELAQEETK
jgi:hypothetical protein